MSKELTEALNGLIEAAATAAEVAASGAPDREVRFADDEVAAARSRVEALCRPQWQPIETAPKGGRDLILLLTPSDFPQFAYSNTWWTAGFSVECKPTHWMPLPPPPGATPPAPAQTIHDQIEAAKRAVSEWPEGLRKQARVATAALPAQREALSEERLREMRDSVRQSPEAEHTVWWLLLCRAVERAHGIGGQP